MKIRKKLEEGQIIGLDNEEGEEEEEEKEEEKEEEEEEKKREEREEEYEDEVIFTGQSFRSRSNSLAIKSSDLHELGVNYTAIIHEPENPGQRFIIMQEVLRYNPRYVSLVEHYAYVPYRAIGFISLLKPGSDLEPDPDSDENSDAVSLAEQVAEVLKIIFFLLTINAREKKGEIRKRLIVDCTFIDSKTTVKAFIDPKSQRNSIGKALAKKMDLYITRMDESKYPAVEALGISTTNAGKKVMVKGWLRDEEVSISLPNIFKLEPPSYLEKSYEHFLVIDKPEYNLVLGSTWLTRLGDRIDGRDGKYWGSNKEKMQYYTINSIDILFPSLYTFYELLFPKFTVINSDGEVILTNFSKQNMDRNSIDLSGYYDSEYSETEFEFSDSETETESSRSNPEITNMIKKSLLDAENNKHRKRHHKISRNIPPAPPPPRSLDSRKIKRASQNLEKMIHMLHDMTIDDGIANYRRYTHRCTIIRCAIFGINSTKTSYFVIAGNLLLRDRSLNDSSNKSNNQINQITAKQLYRKWHIIHLTFFYCRDRDPRIIRSGYLDNEDALYDRPGKYNNIFFSRNFIYIYSSPAPAPTPIPITIDPVTQKLKQDILALQNKIAQMETEAEWKSEARSRGLRKREKRSPTKMYNALSEKIDLSPATLASFYRHQRSLLKTSLDKIETWVEKENKKKITRSSLVVVAVIVIEIIFQVIVT
ncbi:hypothetical protein Glove_345g72 [Diversispora epigaea]|uniref:Uncharacterized protein n=1 Tax=Diversispora epigaea TaxID=1348612 RepID=A0A397HJS4_9GLOM|nr:hypothetical protein Glove_345g72 [Diversispora epigaea]